MGFVRERPGTHGGVRDQALYDDVKGHRRSAGTFVTETEAVRAWQRAEDRPVHWERTRDAARGLYRAEPTGAATWRGYRTTEPLTIPRPPPLWYA
jgi:hypothetical protein